MSEVKRFESDGTIFDHLRLVNFHLFAIEQFPAKERITWINTFFTLPPHGRGVWHNLGQL